jgi:hypothetical protein
MEDHSFDRIARTLAAAGDRRQAIKRLGVGAFVGLVGLRATEALAKPNKGSSGKKAKVAICHKPGTPAEKTLFVPEAAVAGHLGHGDTRGECDGGYGGGDCKDDITCGICETCVGGECVPVSCGYGQTCTGGVCCQTARICGSTCLGPGECCTDGVPGCPEEGTICQNGTCVEDPGTGGEGDGEIGDPCDNINDCSEGLRCCGAGRGNGAVCTDVVCKDGYREQGGFPNGPRCECCGNGFCSTRYIKRLIQS